MKTVAYPYLLSRFWGVVASVLHFNAFSDNSLTPWSAATPPCGADSAGSHSKHLQEGKESYGKLTGYNPWYLIPSEGLKTDGLLCSGLKEYCYGIAV